MVDINGHRIHAVTTAEAGQVKEDGQFLSHTQFQSQSQFQSHLLQLQSTLRSSHHHQFMLLQHQPQLQDHAQVPASEELNALMALAFWSSLLKALDLDLALPQQQQPLPRQLAQLQRPPQLEDQELLQDPDRLDHLQLLQPCQQSTFQAEALQSLAHQDLLQLSLEEALLPQPQPQPQHQLQSITLQ